MSSIPPELAHTIYDSAILIVDDNEVNRIFLSEILRSRGFTKLIMAISGEEALVKLDRHQPEIILLDLVMPGGMDGFACCAAIRQQPEYRDLPILIQTAITEPELRVQAFANGATDFVSKPIYPDELYARVMVHLEKRHSLKTLQIYKYRIEAELDSARQLQLATLPSAQDILEIRQRCHLDVASYFEPSSEIGGDFWGMKNIFPNQTAFWLVDFSGHGVAAALNAFRLHAYLKEASILAARPGDYLSHLNDNLLHLLMRGQFATMFYGIVDTQSKQLFYACACIPSPIVLRRGTGKAEIIDGTGRPLGIGMNLYLTQTIPFHNGDLLLLYSDALIETPDASGVRITEQDIATLLEQNPTASATNMRDILLHHFKQHTGGVLNDDLTLTICTQTVT